MGPLWSHCLWCSRTHTQTPCGFLLVGAAFSSCRGDPMIRRALPALHRPVNHIRNNINYLRIRFEYSLSNLKLKYQYHVIEYLEICINLGRKTYRQEDAAIRRRCPWDFEGWLPSFLEQDVPLGASFPLLRSPGFPPSNTQCFVMIIQ